MRNCVQALLDLLYDNKVPQLASWLTRSWADLQDRAVKESTLMREQLERDKLSAQQSGDDDEDLMRRCSESTFQSLADFANTIKETGEMQKQSIMDLSTHALADALTLVEAAFFRAVSPQEFVLKVWGIKGPLAEASKRNLRAYTAWFNKVTLWAAKEVCLVFQPAQRVLVVEKLIKLAGYLLQHRNFNGLFAVTAGLNHGAVIRLKQTWAQVSERSRKQFKEIATLMDPSHNFRNYRAHIKELEENEFHKGACIPLTGVTMKDLTYINEMPKWVQPDAPPADPATADADTSGEGGAESASAAASAAAPASAATTVKAAGGTGAGAEAQPGEAVKHVNYSKLRAVYLKLTQDIVLRQRVRYNLQFDPVAKAYCEALHVITEDLLYHFSDKIEARKRKVGGRLSMRASMDSDSITVSSTGGGATADTGSIGGGSVTTADADSVAGASEAGADHAAEADAAAASVPDGDAANDDVSRPRARTLSILRSDSVTAPPTP